MHFVYELYDPRTEVAGYVGITGNPNVRLKQHLDCSGDNERKKAWIRRLQSEDAEPKMRIVEIVDNEEQASIREKHWIKHYLYRGIQLTNIQYADDLEPVNLDGEIFARTIDMQWAVFFKHLGITYEYRQHSYDLEGSTYTPDFWLPNLKYFIVIGGLEQIESDRLLPRLLSWQTEHHVYIAYGNIGLSKHKEGGTDYGLHLECSPMLSFYNTISRTRQKLQISNKAKYILRMLDKLQLRLRLHYGYFLIEPTIYHALSNNFVKDHMEAIQEQARVLPILEEDIAQVTSELKKFEGFREDDDDEEWDVEFNDDDSNFSRRWVECKNCGHVFVNGGLSLCEKGDQLGGKYCKGSIDTPRLIAAYAAVQQARFEHH